MRTIILLVWLVATVAWVIFIAYWADQTWPVLSLDLSPNDPATQAAWASAQRWHVVKLVAAAAVPPAVVLAVIYVAFPRRSKPV